MQTAHRPEPQQASVDDYSRFYFSSDHCTIPIVSTPRLPREPPPKRKKHELQQQQPQQTSAQSTDTSDPSLEDRAYGTCLVIGRSGTGKSTLLKHLVSRMPPRRLLYLVNVRADESEEYSRSHVGGASRVRHANLSGLKEVASHSTIIVEDIISMKNSEQVSLREGINYTAHHRSCKIFCVTHTVYKTGVFSMMPLFHFVIFTSSRANLPIIKQTLQRFSMTKEEVTQLLATVDRATRDKSLTTGDPRSAYFFYDCAKMRLGCSRNLLKPGETFFLPEPDTTSQSGQREKLFDSNRATSTGAAGAAAVVVSDNENALKHFSGFFKGHRWREMAEGVLKLILNSETARRHFDPGDLSFVFSRRSQQSERGGEAKKISVVDYVHALLDESRQPSEEQKVVHRFLRSRVSLPAAAIANTTLRNLDSQ